MRALTASAALVLAAALLLPVAALADLGSEVAQGQQIANAVRSGQRDCSQLSGDQLELIGEYAMDGYLHNRQAHEAMNQHMVQVVGEAGERRMHQALGARFAGCPGASSTGWTGPMAAMMGAYGHGYSGMGPGMMNGRDGNFGPGGFGSHMHDHDGGISGWAVAGIALGAALIGGLAVALTLLLRRG
ncbi:MAG: hypothetical protein WB462_02885 [Solirubrobacterales bacterium]